MLFSAVCRRRYGFSRLKPFIEGLEMRRRISFLGWRGFVVVIVGLDFHHSDNAFDAVVLEIAQPGTIAPVLPQDTGVAIQIDADEEIRVEAPPRPVLPLPEILVFDSIKAL